MFLGLVVLGVGVSFVLGVRGFGTRAIRLSLYTSALPWNRQPEPTPERIGRQRLAFGFGLVLIGVIAIVAALSSA